MQWPTRKISLYFVAELLQTRQCATGWTSKESWFDNRAAVWVKRRGCLADRPPPFIREIKMSGVSPPLQMFSWLHRGAFIFTAWDCERKWLYEAFTHEGARTWRLWRRLSFGYGKVLISLINEACMRPQWNARTFTSVVATVQDTQRCRRKTFRTRRETKSTTQPLTTVSCSFYCTLTALNTIEAVIYHFVIALYIKVPG